MKREDYYKTMGYSLSFIWAKMTLKPTKIVEKDTKTVWKFGPFCFSVHRTERADGMNGMERTYAI